MLPPFIVGCTTHHSLQSNKYVSNFHQDRRIFIDLTVDAPACTTFAAATTRRTRLAISLFISGQLMLPPPPSGRAEDLVVRRVGVDVLPFLKQGTDGHALGAMGPIDSSEWALTARRHRWLFQVLFSIHHISIYSMAYNVVKLTCDACRTFVSCSVKECVTPLIPLTHMSS